MPNDTDVFLLRATVDGIAADIMVKSESSYQEVAPGDEYSVLLTFVAGANPEAVSFGVYFFPSSAVRNTAQAAILLESNWGSEPTIPGQSATAPSATFSPNTPVGAGSARTNAQVNGTIPNVTTTTNWFGLVAIYQAALN